MSQKKHSAIASEELEMLYIFFYSGKIILKYVLLQIISVNLVSTECFQKQYDTSVWFCVSEIR